MAIACCYFSGALSPNPKYLLRPRRDLLRIPAGICGAAPSRSFRDVPALVARASKVDSFESSAGFAKRMERAWLISQQPRPIVCSSCGSKGYVECKWCGGTGFFILGENMLCEVPSRNTTCRVCLGKGCSCCPDCKGTGYRAKWLEEPQSSSK